MNRLLPDATWSPPRRPVPGKTLAFVLPLIHQLETEPRTKGVRAVVLVPTRELAIQINEVFVKMANGTGIRAATVVGGVGENPQLQAIRKGAQVVIATPGRLYDFLSRNLVNLGSARMLVLDEADRMLDMGFLPTIKRIMDTMPAERQTLFFSATIETSVKHLVEVHVPDAVRVEVGSTTKPVEQVDLHLYEVEATRKLRPAAEDAARRVRARSWFSPAPSTAPTAWRASCRAERQSGRHPRRPQPEPAQPGAARASRTATIACWWPPMWPPAAFTSRASRTW